MRSTCSRVCTKRLEQASNASHPATHFFSSSPNFVLLTCLILPHRSRFSTVIIWVYHPRAPKRILRRFTAGS